MLRGVVLLIFGGAALKYRKLFFLLDLISDKRPLLLDKSDLAGMCLEAKLDRIWLLIH